MIIWVSESFKPLLARRAIVPKNEMITWVCDDHLGRRRYSDLRWRVRLVFGEYEMII